MTRPLLNWILLYVENPRRSAGLYDRLLGASPVIPPQADTDFVMYALPNGLILGLWARAHVSPDPTMPGGAEVSFTEPDEAAVHARHAEWRALGLDIIQPPTHLDFGFTFTARDPDGHRLRVFAPPPGVPLPTA